MASSTIRRLSQAAVIAGLIAGTFTPLLRADSADPGRLRPDSDKSQPSFQAHVESKSDGIDVHISARETIPGNSGNSPQAAPAAPGPPLAAAQPAAQSNSAPQPAPDSTIRAWSDDAGYHRVTASGHSEDLVAPNVSSASPGLWSPDDHPNSQPYLVFVDNQFQGVTWIPDQPNVNPRFGPAPEPPPNTPGAGCGGCTDARQVALDMVTHIPLPPIKLRVNPDIGLVGMAGWFWVDGYRGETIQESRTVTVPPPAPGLPPSSFTVTVRLWGEDYSWAFGDGKTLETTSLGKAYPTESDIQHNYQHSSLPFADGFPVFLTVRFHAEFSVNGGAPQGLPPIQHTWQANHPVQEIQAVLNRQP